MGVINHEALIATTWSRKDADKIENWTREINMEDAFLFSEEQTNGYITIVLIPNGSKKGWPEAEQGDNLREDFKKKLQSFAYEDDSNPFSWVEVGYGEFGQKLLDGNNKNCYNDKDYAEEG